MQLWRFNCQRMTRSNRQANTMKESVKFLTLAMVFLSAVKISKQCGPPGPDAPPPPTLEELVQLAPIVVRGYVVRKIGDVDVGYTACLYITHVYKGSLNSNYICADNFGPSSACLVNPTYGVEYLFFLNKTSTGYRARYDRSFSAAEPFNDKVLTTVRDGICCPRDLGGEYNVFTYNYIYRATVTLHRIAFHTGTDTKTLLVTLLLYTSIFINYTSIFFKMHEHLHQLHEHLHQLHEHLHQLHEHLHQLHKHLHQLHEHLHQLHKHLLPFQFVISV